VLTLDPVTIEFADLTVTLQTKEYFTEGSSEIRIERRLLKMSRPDAKVELNEYMVGCYGTTEYPEDMTGITLRCESKGQKADRKIEYAYQCREESLEGADAVSAVIPAVQTKVSLYPADQEQKNAAGVSDAKGYIKEGYAFSPMYTLGYRKQMGEREVFTTCLRLEKAN
jgi:hypothetical protein